MSPILDVSGGPDRTLRLLIDWPIQGLRMRGWIVHKEARAAALLVAAGFAEYVLYGTTPPASQLEWARSLVQASEREGNHVAHS